MAEHRDMPLICRNPRITSSLMRWRQMSMVQCSGRKRLDNTKMPAVHTMSYCRTAGPKSSNMKPTKTDTSRASDTKALLELVCLDITDECTATNVQKEL